MWIKYHHGEADSAFEGLMKVCLAESSASVGSVWKQPPLGVVT